jgi:hypothetical protein
VVILYHRGDFSDELFRLVKLYRYGFFTENSFHHRPIFLVVDQQRESQLVRPEADMEENREQRVPTAFADLERLREQLNELGLRIRRPAAEQFQGEKKDEAAGTLILRAK